MVDFSVNIISLHSQMSSVIWSDYFFLVDFFLMPMYSYSCRMSGKVPETVQITGNELKILKVDENVNTTFVCEVKNRIGTGKDQVAAFVRGEHHDTNKRTRSSLQMRNSCINVSREVFYSDK